jgi:hypothetical protein
MLSISIAIFSVNNFCLDRKKNYPMCEVKKYTANRGIIHSQVLAWFDVAYFKIMLTMIPCMLEFL